MHIWLHFILSNAAAQGRATAQETLLLGWCSWGARHGPGVCGTMWGEGDGVERELCTQELHEPPSTTHRRRRGDRPWRTGGALIARAVEAGVQGA